MRVRKKDLAMDLPGGLLPIKRKVLFTVLSLILSQTAFAVGELPALPASVEPGRVSSQISPNQPTAPGVAPQSLKTPEQPKNELGEEAKKIKFVLTKIILEGNHVYSEKQLYPIYKDKLNKQITVQELQDIVQSISNYYRNTGYILTRAILPPQHVKNGVVIVRILEGYVDQVNVIGHPKGARGIIQAYGDKIARDRPVEEKVMERYLLIANEVPGVEAKAVLEPSQGSQAASTMDIAAQSKTLSGYISYDDYGTRYVGPQQITTGIEGDSLFRSGDATRLTYATTSKANELQYKEIQHQTPIGTNGMNLILDANQAITNPLFALQPAQIAGLADTYSGTLSYPVIRSRSQNLTLTGGWMYLDSYVTTFDLPLYTDHIRSLKFGGSYDFADSYKGANLLLLNLEQGVNVLGATTNNESLTTSRYGATGVFTKVNAQASRTQQLVGRFSAFGLVKGQYSFEPLLISEQFGFGGPQLGRGYDPAEITGDRGAAGSVELRMDTAPGNPFLQTAQYYVFYDAGETWNMRNVVPNVSTKLSATSTGIGVRLYFLKYLSGNFTFAQPLTRQVQSLELIGNGKCPRILFSVTAAD